MRSRQRQNARLLFITALFPLVACASSNARGRTDDPIEDDRDRVERERDEEWERAERDRVERERVERDRIERNTPSREVDGAAYPAGWDRRSDAPRTRLWIDGGESTYRPGDRVRALFRVERDAYVTVVRVDTDGRMRILFPRSPRESAWVMADHDYRVPGSSGGSFVVDDPTGLGYVFAITSFERFDYSSISYGRAWDYEAIGYRVTGDPFIAVRRLADRIAYDDRTGYATAYDEYYVGRHVDYPRSACYDCHAVGSPAVYDPYGHACPRVRIVVYDDPYYYPYRYYPGTRVVYAPRPRYESKPGGSPSPTPGPGGGSAGGYASGGTLVEHRRREEELDLRRPGSPTSDPNVVARPTGNAGATRPGDDVIAPSTSERRRVEDVDATPPTPTRDGLGTPRRDGDSAPPPTAGNGGSSGGPGTGDEGKDRSRPSPRRDPGAPPAGNGDEEHGRSSDPRQEPRRGSSDEPRGATPPDSRSEPRGEPREQPRREAPSVEGDRRDDSRANERRGRPDEPRFDPPREAATRSEPPRPEPRRESARDDSPSESRSEPRMERRSEPHSDTRTESQPRAEPRSVPKEERRSETKAEKRSEPRSEPKRESKGTSTRRRSD